MFLLHSWCGGWGWTGCSRGLRSRAGRCCGSHAGDSGAGHSRCTTKRLPTTVALEREDKLVIEVGERVFLKGVNSRKSETKDCGEGGDHENDIITKIFV